VREIGLGCILPGVALLAFPMYQQVLAFLSLQTDHARLAGGGFLVVGGTVVALNPR
jgi:hypothetical protein